MLELVTSEISVQEAHRRQQHGAVLLDVREPFEFAARRAPRALNVPLGQVPMRLPTIAADAEVLVMCASGGRRFRWT